MNQPSNQQWTHQEPFDSMASLLPEEDFSNFIDLDNMDLNFQMFDNNGMEMQDGQPMPPQNQSMSLPDGAPNFNLEQYGDMSRIGSSMGDFPQALHSQQGGPNGIDFGGQSSYQQPNGNPQGTPGQSYPTHYNIPPTPNSAEMYPGNMRYPHQQMDNQGHWAAEHQYQMRKDDVMASLTPLVSPHLPGNAHALHVLPEYAMPGAYLSPLNSPAIRPQPNNGQYPAYTPSRTADSSLAGSPIDLNFEKGNDTATSTDERPRKTRKKTAAAKSSVPAPRPRQSTSAIQRRKESPTINPPAPGVAMDMQRSPGLPNGQAQASRFSGGASDKSNSPLSNGESVMAPPPKPSSVMGTPPIIPRSHIEHNLIQPPATPASLMRLRQQQQSGNKDVPSSGLHNELTSPISGAMSASMEDLRLPEAAAPASDADKRSAPRIITSDPRSVRSTPAPLGMSKTPGPQAILPSPAGSIASSKTETKGGRGSRKRNSTNSSLVSPAIRPKISPSIKALLPDGSTVLNNDTHTLLLASKSNYQNIIEGTTLPGVSYPAELSTNLTSKRTSHKIAEQGRRNRINMALQEMQSLLPTSPTFLAAARKDDGSLLDTDVAMSNSPEDAWGSVINGKATDGGSGGESNLPASAMRTPATPMTLNGQAGGGNSKAATVELAIDYIKHLNSTLADKDTEMERLKAELRALREKCGSLKTVGEGPETPTGPVVAGDAGAEAVVKTAGNEVGNAALAATTTMVSA